jgi:transposase InsO family protein
MRYECINQNEHRYSVDEMCEVMEVSRSGYYDWKGLEPSAREREDGLLKEAIARIYALSKGRYGHRPIHAHLQEEGLDCGRDQALRLTREMGIEGDQFPRCKPLGTDSIHDYGYSANLLKANGKPSSLDEVWVADTTYLKIEGCWMYLATVVDLFSRPILGWSVSASNDADLVCQTLRVAAMTRGSLLTGIIHHSDRGSTYAGNKYRLLQTKLGMLSSMSAKGNCYDNAAMESFYGRFKVSSVGNEVFAGQEELKAVVFEYVEPFYNRFRKHSSLGYKSPIQFDETFTNN